MFRYLQHVVVALAACAFLATSTSSFADEMRVVDLPLHDGAVDVSYMKRRGDVRYQVMSDFKTVGNFYAKKLAEQLWTKSKKDNLQRNFWIQTFSKGDVSLEVRVDSRANGKSEVRLTPKGMMWEEDDQPTPKDLPLPAEVTDLQYNDFLGWIRFNSPSSFESTVEFLSTELEDRNWEKTATEIDVASFIRMKFAYDKSTLEIDVRKEDSGSSVWIRTKGMQWDGMKAEIERAKKESEKVAAEKAAKEEAAEMAEALRKRRARPKQGIDKLPKLPSEAKVVMDGDTFTLPRVIAYEVFEYGTWSTKIVATQKVVKLDGLLARLKKTGSDADEEGQPPSWPQPYLLVVLDDDDRPQRMSFVAGGTPGNGSGDELTGQALVEDGRARGTVALKEPGSFFEKVYTAEISFDVPVLTRDSVPQKRLAGAPKLANSGELAIGNKRYQLDHVVAYEMKLFDDPMTAVLLTAKPINLRNLTAALGKEAADNYFEFIPQVKLLIDSDDNVNSVSIWADNLSLGSNSGLSEDIVIEDGRARGIVKMEEPKRALNSDYRFQVSFDVDVLGQRRTAISQRRTAGGLTADSYRGLPVPEGHQGMQAEGSEFRFEAKTTVTADLDKVVEFYRMEIASGDWGQWKKEGTNANVGGQMTELAFAGPPGALTVRLSAKGKETAITLISRDAVAAKAAGMLPSPGKSRLFIANDSPKESVITVSKRDYKIPAGAGVSDPKTGFNWEVAPGNYTLQIRDIRGRPQSETLKIERDKTMGVIIDSSGRFRVIELY